MSQSESFEGKFLTPHFTWVLSGPPPDAGYSMDARHRLYRNGEIVGKVQRQEWDLSVGSWWIHYLAPRGGPMDVAR